MLPLIGVTTSYSHRTQKTSLNLSYIEAIRKAGGIPVAVMPLGDQEGFLSLLGRLDGIIFSGGADVDPFYYGEEPHRQLGEVCPRRDGAEIFLAREMFKAKIPILGICRGLQVLNIALGGNLFQDIPSCIDTAIKHRQDAPKSHASHGVEILGGTRIYDIIGQSHLRVNSFHHQSVKDLAAELKVAAVAQDGVVEAVETRDRDTFCIGVQWHPEEMIGHDPGHFAIFREFIGAIK